MNLSARDSWVKSALWLARIVVATRRAMELSESKTVGWYVDEKIPSAMKEGGARPYLMGTQSTRVVVQAFLALRRLFSSRINPL